MCGVARSTGIRDVGSTFSVLFNSRCAVHMLHARTDRDVCVRLFVPSRPGTDAWLKTTAHRVLPKKTHIIYTPSMLAHERSSPPPSLFSSSSTNPTPSTSQVTPPINKHCDDPQNKEHGPVAKTTSSTFSPGNDIDETQQQQEQPDRAGDCVNSDSVKPPRRGPPVSKATFHRRQRLYRVPNAPKRSPRVASMM